LPRSSDHSAARFCEPRPVSLALRRRWAFAPAAGPASPPAGDPPPRHLLVVALIALVTLVLAIATATAGAEEIFTSQAAAANATDSTWIPAPPKPAALCIVDTGNDINPDTSNVIARFSVDGGDPGDLSPDHHGTLMSMIAAAPYNGFGMVGAAPSINIVSVRASRDGRTFGGTDLGTAIQTCRNFRETYNIKTVSLSLGGPAIIGLDQSLMATIENMVTSAKKAGLNVVAAAGNHPGAVDWPAGYGPVFAVGASDDLGQRCVFAADGPEVDLWAPGCPVDAASGDGASAWVSGSSESAVFTAAVLTQLRQLNPELSVEAAENALLHGMTSLERRVLHVERSFLSVGLADYLAVGRAATPRLSVPYGEQSEPVLARNDDPSVQTLSPAVSSGMRVPSSTQQPQARATAKSRLPRPVARDVRLHRRTLSVKFGNRPRRGEAVVWITTRTRSAIFPQRRLLRGSRTDRLRIRVSGMLKELSIIYHDMTGVRADSTPLVLHPRPS
jgi:hypothetical protein